MTDSELQSLVTLEFTRLPCYLSVNRSNQVTEKAVLLIPNSLSLYRLYGSIMNNVLGRCGAWHRSVQLASPVEAVESASRYE